MFNFSICGKKIKCILRLTVDRMTIPFCPFRFKSFSSEMTPIQSESLSARGERASLT